MIDVHFIVEHGPYKADSYSQFKEDKAQELVELGVAEIIGSSDSEPPNISPDDPPVSDPAAAAEPIKSRKSK